MKSIKELEVLQDVMNSELGVESQVEALKDIITTTKNEEITVNRIKEKVASVFNIKMEDFNSKKRTRSIAYPRQIAMYLSRELTDLSLPKIGEEFGGRDHTTVIHAHDKIIKDIQVNEEIKSKIEKIILDLKGKLVSDHKEDSKLSKSLVDTFDALKSLGYKQVELNPLIKQLEGNLDQSTDALLKLSLQILGKKRGK